MNELKQSMEDDNDRESNDRVNEDDGLDDMFTAEMIADLFKNVDTDKKQDGRVGVSSNTGSNVNTNASINNGNENNNNNMDSNDRERNTINVDENKNDSVRSRMNSKNDVEIKETRRSTRVVSKPDIFVSTDYDRTRANLATDEPLTYQQAIESDESKQWGDAIKDELSLRKIIHGHWYREIKT